MSASSGAVADPIIEHVEAVGQDSFMTPHIRRVIAAAAERILPRDQWPGASDANVIGYVERLVEHPSFIARRPLLPRGVALMDSLAGALFERGFADCSAEQQDIVLARVQSIPHPTTRRFFTALVKMTITGYFSDPAHGGNRDGIVWAHMGRRPEAPWPNDGTTS